MGPPRLLLRDLIDSGQQLLLASFLLHQHWLPSSLALPRLRCPDGFKLLLVLLLVSAALAEVRFIASSSMAPTLRPADRAVAEKVTFLFRRPSIGDIVFFKVPTALQNCGVNKDVVFIKRVIATPGDFVEVRQGQLIVNGVAQKEHYAPTHGSYTMEAMVCEPALLSVSIVSLNNIEELLLPGPGPEFHLPKLLRRLPQGHVFVMGDNRNNSCDSRDWGPLPISNIVGRYMMSFTRSSFQ